MAEDSEERLAHATPLPVQGQLHHLTDSNAASLWSDVVHTLPPECSKFALNVAQDTLPHNANLSVLRKETGLLNQCKLCNQHQSLLHDLNHCQTNCVVITNDMTAFYRSSSKPSSVSVPRAMYEITADLQNTDYSFPSVAASADLHPDLELWSDSLV